MSRGLEILTDGPDTDDGVEGVLSVDLFIARVQGQPDNTPPANTLWNAMLDQLARLDARPVRLVNDAFNLRDLRRAWARVRSGK